ncbi:MAG: hypothetical protein ACE5JS_13385 [Nitrospinota bacterium]
MDTDLNPTYVGVYRHTGKSDLATHEECVWFHELAHAGHGRIADLSCLQTHKKEAVAEFSAAVLMALYGKRDHSGNAWHYIRSYYPTDTLRALYCVLNDCREVIGLILAEADRFQAHKQAA